MAEILEKQPKNQEKDSTTKFVSQMMNRWIAEGMKQFGKLTPQQEALRILAYVDRIREARIPGEALKRAASLASEEFFEIPSAGQFVKLCKRIIAQNSWLEPIGEDEDEDQRMICVTLYRWDDAATVKKRLEKRIFELGQAGKSILPVAKIHFAMRKELPQVEAE